MAALSVKVTRRGRVTGIKEGLKDISKKVAVVGWPENATYNNGTPVALVAAANEYGRYARPFIRPTMLAQRNTWLQLLANGAVLVMNGSQSMEQVLEAVAAQAHGDIVKTISNITTPPLKESTIKNRQWRMNKEGRTGSLTKPLIDSEKMLNTLTYSVEDK